MTIDPDDLKRPASLTLWPSTSDAPKAVEPRDYPTLKEALEEANLALDAESATPWIMTDSGLILSPAWLRGHLSETRAAPNRDASRPEARLSAALPAMPDRKHHDGGARRLASPPVALGMRGLGVTAAARP